MKKQIVDRLDRSLVSDRIYQNTYEALKRLIDNSYYSQLTFPQSYVNGKEDNRYKRDLGYLKEFCTIRMSTARRSGHTTSMCKIAKEYFDKVIFISPQYDMASNLAQSFRVLHNDSSFTKVSFSKVSLYETYTEKGYYLFGSQNSLDIFRGREAEAIFVDCSFSLTPKKEDEIYSTLGPCMCNYPQRFFVFIQ